MEEIYLLCEDSMEGIFTGIYEAYARREGHKHIHIETGMCSLHLFGKTLTVETDLIKADKVARTLRQRLGQEVYLHLCHAVMTTEEEKGEAVYRTVVLGLSLKQGNKVMDILSDPYVYKVFQLSRRVSNEVHHWKGFLRFQELESKVLFARIGPVNHILTFLVPHFADRLPGTDFMIYDEKRNIYAVHPSSGEWYLVSGKDVDQEIFTHYTEEEGRYQDLFRIFCQKIAVTDRENLKLQRSLLPLRFQEYMVEFQKKQKSDQ